MAKWLNARSSFSILVLFLFLLLGRIVFAETATPSATPTPESSSSSDSNICTSVQECADQKLDCSKCIEYLASKKSEASGKAKTLSSEIAVTNSQIKLTEARIRATEQKIKELQEDIGIAKGKIQELESTIDRATRLLIERIAAVYQVGRLEPWQIFLTARNIDDVFSRLKYLRIVQIYDKRQVYAAEQAKTDYSNQKEIFEDKEGEAEALSKKLSDYTSQLEGEKKAKDTLLAVTRNDEARYQRLLSQALAERKAIVAAFSQAVSRLNSGEGEKAEKGATIALLGNSGGPDCSSGPHLHFTVLQNSSPINPAQKLKNISPGWDNSPDGPFDFTGDWDWPISNPSITQGYGMTYWAQRRWYDGNIHDGIDMTGGSTISTPKSGKMITGSTTCDSASVPGVSLLKYAAVKHEDDPSIITLYLHIQ